MPPPNYDGRQVWFPCIDKLMPGDILLTRSVYDEVAGGDKDARLIRTFTFGRFEHAAICTSPPTVAEAGGGDEGGVFTLSLARCFTHDLKNVRVLRWPDAAAAARAAEWCQRQVGRPYSRFKAISSVFPVGGLATGEDRGVFCSSLVAHAFKLADPDAFAGLKPDKMSPSGLGRLDGFLNVTNDLFTSGLAPRNAEEMTALDGKRAWTPAYAQTLAALRYAKELLPLSDGLVDGFPEAELNRPETFNDVLAFLPNAYDAIAELAPGRRAAYAKALVGIDTKASQLLRDGQLSGAVREMIALDRAERQRLIDKSRHADPDIDLDHQARLLKARGGSLVSRQKAHASFAPYREALVSIQLWDDLFAESTRELEAAMAEQADVLQRCRHPARP